MAMMMRRDVGELCVQGKIITPEQLQEAREIQGQQGGDIGEILVQQEMINPIQLLQARAHFHGIKPVDLGSVNIDASEVNVVQPHVERRHGEISVLKMVTDKLIDA